MVVYQFPCAGCNSCYIGETSRHFSIRIKEHTVSDKNSHIFKHFSQFPSCRACTHHLVFVSWTQRIALLILKLKEAFYISKNKPDLKVTVDLHGCHPKNHPYPRRLNYNHRKVYIIVKLIQCRIRRNNFF